MTAPNTKTRILTTAISLFAKSGFSAVSMREIAKAAGISAPALYNHFDSKEALYQAAVSEAFADKDENLYSALNNEGTPLERLRGFVYLMANALHDDPAFGILMQRELLDGDEVRLRFLSQTIFNPLIESLLPLIVELRPDSDAHLLTKLILGMVKQHSLMHHLRPFLFGDYERTPQQITDLIMAVVTPYFNSNGASQ